MSLRPLVRRARVMFRQMLGREPVLRPTARLKLEFCGTDYGGWPIVAGSLSHDAVVVDIGLGEDLSFSEALIEKYGCSVYGFDPTPKSIDYVRRRNPKNFSLFELGISASGGDGVLFLPNDPAHVSGSLYASDHVGREKITVKLIDVARVPETIGTTRIDVLKMDIEGAEFEVIDAPGFGETVANTAQLCVEFHHRWERFGKNKTEDAVRRLGELGFEIAWVSSSNENVLFVRKSMFP
jgi:FkbM family methyltransferase